MSASSTPKADILPGAVSVCIVNWNTREHLARCLTRLSEAAESMPLQVVVVDNDSADGSARLVRERFPSVELIEAGANLGFAGGANLAFEHAHGELLLLLNPDIEIDAGTIRGMVEHLAAESSLAAVGPALAGPEGRLQTQYFGRFPSHLQVALFFTLLGPLSLRMRALRHRVFDHSLAGSGPVEVDQLPGACMLLRRSALEAVGSYDPDYFIWYEDVDWCYRARRQGWRLVALPTLKVTHWGGASFANWSADQFKWQFIRSFFRFLSKHRKDGLLRWASAVLRADLRAKGLLFPLLRRLGVAGIPNYSAGLRTTLRLTILDIVSAHRRGELVSFASAKPPARVDKAARPGGNVAGRSGTRGRAGQSDGCTGTYSYRLPEAVAHAAGDPHPQ